MKTRDHLNPIHSHGGNALLVVLLLCLALLVVSAAFMRSMTSTRRVAQKADFLTQAREGAEAALGYAGAQLNKEAVSLSSLSEDPLHGYVLAPADIANLAGTGTKNNLLSTSIEVKPGMISSTKTDMLLNASDPAYAGDQNAGMTMSVRSGLIYAKASAKDPVSGALTTAYVAGVVQVREQTWLNYGMFYNMDLEVFPGKPMDVKGPIHTNADMYLGSDGSTLNLYKKVTAAGHIYRGIKYLIKGFNADGSATGFQDRSGTGGWAPGGTSPQTGTGTGQVFASPDGTTLVEMKYGMDCLGTKTSPTANLSTWTAFEIAPATWNHNVMDISESTQQFTPPGLPLYIPEDYSTKTTTEMRNNGYAMIEPQLPATDDRRYYGRKSDTVENLKFSALAGMTIVVEDLDLTADATSGSYYNAAAPNTGTLAASVNGTAIPWKLVWYDGGTIASQPINKENLPARDTTTLLPTKHEIDPFGRNDEVDKLVDNTVVVTMRRNLKALLRDAIMVLPYHEVGAGATFGTGVNTANITTYPASAADCSFVPTALTTRYNQKAASWPQLDDNTILPKDPATYNPIYYGNTITTYASDRYPDSSTASAGSPGKLNATTGIYSGLYDRRQGYNQSTGNSNDALKGAMHVVYINLQKLNWIINHSTLWTNPADGTVIYDFSKSFTNLIYVDLPSKAKDATRFALTNSDKVCPAAGPTSTKPGYCVLLDKGSRLPRLPYDQTLRTPGFTLATNGPLYIKGNFNADGLSGTGDSVLPDAGSNQLLWYSSTSPTTSEVPAMVAADAVTFLTEGFNAALSAQSPVNGSNGNGTVKQYDGYANNTTATSANFQEISTAIISGITATIPWYYSTANTGATYTNAVLQCSGWVNNLPHFLENNGNITVRYRGSMAALYESEAATAHFIQGQHSYWYGPPTRDWGYAQYFAAAMYPPGTPVLRTTRLISVYDITAAQYATGPAQPP